MWERDRKFIKNLGLFFCNFKFQAKPWWVLIPAASAAEYSADSGFFWPLHIGTCVPSWQSLGLQGFSTNNFILLYEFFYDVNICCIS